MRHSTVTSAPSPIVCLSQVVFFAREKCVFVDRNQTAVFPFFIYINFQGDITTVFN